MSKSAESGRFEFQTELSRDLGLSTALAIGVGTMIAAGIFTLSGLAVRNVGSAAVVAFLLAGAAALCTALTYCEFSSLYPESGEGYLYARKTFAPPLAYFVGWSLMLGYISSCAFYISSLSSYFQEFIYEIPFEPMSGLVALAALTLLNIKGTKESGTFQIVVTIAKVVLLVWFVAGGLAAVDPQQLVDHFSTDFSAIGSTAAMVFITFFGFSAIAASAGEVKNPVRNIPLAIFWSMGIVTLLYTAVVLVVVAAGLTEYTEAAMGSAARQFLGPIGGFVIVAGALFSMISASNASVMAGSRVVLSMSRLRHLPEGVGLIDPRTKTPIIAVVLVGAGIATFTVMFGLEDLAHFADTVLLTALILVNAALIVHRRAHPTMERPFRVPLVPLIPALGILANSYLLVQIANHTMPFVVAVLSLIFGVLGYIAWKGTQSEEESLPGEESVLVQLTQAPTRGDYQILVPVMNPATVGPLMELAIPIAKERNGHIVARRVVQVPDQIPPREASVATEARRAQAEVTVCGVVPKSRDDKRIKDTERTIQDTVLRMKTPNGLTVHGKSIEHDSIPVGIIKEAENYDAVVIGAAGKGVYPEILFGSIPESVAKLSKKSVIMVKSYSPIKALVGRVMND